MALIIANWGNLKDYQTVGKWLISAITSPLRESQAFGEATYKKYITFTKNLPVHYVPQKDKSMVTGLAAGVDFLGYCHIRNIRDGSSLLRHAPGIGKRQEGFYQLASGMIGLGLLAATPLMLRPVSTCVSKAISTLLKPFIISDIAPLFIGGIRADGTAVASRIVASGVAIDTAGTTAYIPLFSPNILRKNASRTSATDSSGDFKTSALETAKQYEAKAMTYAKLPNKMVATAENYIKAGSWYRMAGQLDKATEACQNALKLLGRTEKIAKKRKLTWYRAVIDRLSGDAHIGMERAAETLASQTGKAKYLKIAQRHLEKAREKYNSARALLKEVESLQAENPANSFPRGVIPTEGEGSVRAEYHDISLKLFLLPKVTNIP